MKLGCSYCNECAACGSQHFAEIKELRAANAELVEALIHAMQVLADIYNGETKVSTESIAYGVAQANKVLAKHGDGK